jgi:hypothetical protein
MVTVKIIFFKVPFLLIPTIPYVTQEALREQKKECFVSARQISKVRPYIARRTTAKLAIRRDSTDYTTFVCYIMQSKN